MLIPSIDLMGGKIVQLVQGDKKALEFDNFDYWIERFSKYPLVQVIDLDAARGAGNNRQIVSQIVQRLTCQVGGGIRNLENANEILKAGARRVILGSSLIKEGKIDKQFAATLANALGTAAPVSYTHLDVYKRQLRIYVRVEKGFAEWFEGPNHVERGNGSFFAPAVDRNPAASGIERKHQRRRAERIRQRGGELRVDLAVVQQ